jgi:hypothetical protein
MGLDLVELVMGVEDAFGISIPNSDAEKLTTPRKLTDYLSTRLLPDATPSCLTQRAFYQLRAQAVELARVDRHEVKPATEWSALFPKSDIRNAWKNLGNSLGISDWPGLERPRAVSLLIALLALATGFVAYHATRSNSGSLMFALLAAVSFSFIAVQLTRPTAIVVPLRMRSVGAAAQFLAVREPRAIKGPNPRWSLRDIEATVRGQIEHHLGISKFNLDDEFVRDLRAD